MKWRWKLTHAMSPIILHKAAYLFYLVINKENEGTIWQNPEFFIVEKTAFRMLHAAKRHQYCKSSRFAT